MYKTCTKCKIEKSLECFGKHSGSYLRPDCKECKKDNMKKSAKITREVE